MAMFKTFWYLLNDNTPVLKRRRFFFWFTHERFTDRTYTLQQEIVDLYAKMQAKVVAYDELLLEQERIQNKVFESPRANHGESPTEWMKMPFFSRNKKEVQEPTSDVWKDCVSWIMSGIKGTHAAEFQASIKGVVVKDHSKSGHKPDHTKYSEGGEEVIGSVDTPIRPHNQRNRGKGKQQQNGNSQQ